MDTPATIIISFIAIGLSVLTFVRLNRAKHVGDEIAHGDCPHLPNELHAPKGRH